MKKNLGDMLLSATKKFFTQRIALKALSVCFAMLLWGYVLMVQNPNRDKIIDEANISIDGEADLIARRLIIRGDREELLGNLNVTIRTTLTSYADLNAKDITAYVSVSGITQKGTYSLPVFAKTLVGQVIDFAPEYVNVEVDSLVTRNIPIEINVEGDVADGYWHSGYTLDKNTLEIEGAYTDVNSINKAVATVNIEGIRDSINQSITLDLLDSEGNVVDQNVLLGNMPSAVFKLDVLPLKDVSIDTENITLGASSMDVNYQITGVYVSPNTGYQLVGPRELLDKITALTIDPIDVSSATSSIVETREINVPEGVTLLGNNEVKVYIGITEKKLSKVFIQLPIQVEGIEQGLMPLSNYTFSDVSVSGKISLMNLLERKDIEIYVDLTGLQPGTYTMPVSFRAKDDSFMKELNWELAVSDVLITIVEDTES